MGAEVEPWRRAWAEFAMSQGTPAILYMNEVLFRLAFEAGQRHATCTVGACENPPAFCADHADYDLSGTEERDELRERLKRAEELLLETQQQWGIPWNYKWPPYRAAVEAFNETTKGRRSE